jgi:hypothetical protein
MRPVKSIDMTISLGLAWNESDPVANKDEILKIAQALAK